MIVTLGTPHRQAGQRRGHHFDGLTDYRIPTFVGTRARTSSIGHHSEEACSGELLDLFRTQIGSIRTNQFISGNLFSNELIIWLSLIKGTHHIVAIEKGPRPLGI